MHETMVAQSLIKAISAEAEKQNARPISAKISCGMLNAINDEVISFAFEAIAEGTACQGVKLEIEHKPMQAACKDCGVSFDFEICNAACPKCGSGEFSLSPDAPLLLETIEFETE